MVSKSLQISCAFFAGALKAGKLLATTVKYCLSEVL